MGNPMEPPPGSAPPIRGVIFDLHGTLIHTGSTLGWVQAALDLLEASPTLGGRFPIGSPAPAEPPPPNRRAAALAEQLQPWASNIWDHARDIDPHSERDLSPARHREVYAAMVARTGMIDERLGEALYQTMLGNWTAFDDTRWALSQLNQRGVRLALLSNIGIDPRGVLAREGLAGSFAVEVFSYEVGTVKPDPVIFQVTAAALGLPVSDLLMVGDSAHDDVGAASTGIRTLILPPVGGTVRGLDQVLRLVG